jgi:SAM-dependent methyltransferase
VAYGQFAYIYDRLMEDMPYAQWLRFIRQCWEAYGKPETVADLGCGTGNLAIPLAQSGLRVIGIDLSEHMLAVARDKAERKQSTFPFARGGEIVWAQMDMREWEPAEPVDSVISCCDCLNYLREAEELADAFRCTYAALRPGGTFIFDMHTQHQLKTYADMQPFVLNDDEIAYIWTSELDEERCEIEHELSIFVKESMWESAGSERRSKPKAGIAGERYIRIDETHVQRAYPLDQLEALLKEAGFRFVRQYADFTRREPTERTERAFFVCRKED